MDWVDAHIESANHLYSSLEADDYTTISLRHVPEDHPPQHVSLRNVLNGIEDQYNEIPPVEDLQNVVEVYFGDDTDIDWTIDGFDGLPDTQERFRYQDHGTLKVELYLDEDYRSSDLQRHFEEKRPDDPFDLFPGDEL